MRLKSSIFLWVSLATVLPLSALVLGITAYSEHLYKKNVDKDINVSMNNIVSELAFRLNYEREVVISLASSPAMKRFFPILEAAAEGDLHPQYFEEVDKINEFLAAFQHSVPGLDTVRILDIDGNTLVKVRFGKHLPALFESMEEFPFAEEELVEDDFLDWMLQLESYVLVYGQLPLSRRDYEVNQELSLLNAIVPLSNARGENIGFLTARALGDQLDHMLEALPRSNKYRMSIVELNPGNKQRNGMYLYSDMGPQVINFAQPHDPDLKIDAHGHPKLWQEIEQKKFGQFVDNDDGHRYYYQEFYPYTNQLVSWVVILQLNNSELTAPFQRIRFGLLGFAITALVISLVLANLGARNIAEPISRFSRTLTKYADGEHELKTHLPKGAEELEQLDRSFHYLVETLQNMEYERDRVQHMMLQQAKLASIGEMAAGIGHELNNPLNNILSFSKLIERDLPELTNEAEEDLKGLRDEVSRAGRIVKGLLNFARQVPPEYTEFEIIPWLKDTLLLVEPEAHKRHVETRLLDAPDTVMEGDRQQLQQVLVNLLVNAIQASKTGDRVDVSAEIVEPGIVKVQVTDYGTGIDKNVQDKVFDPFYTTKSVGEGSGLGLSISLGIVQYHEGQLSLINNDQGGVDAIIALPQRKFEA